MLGSYLHILGLSVNRDFRREQIIITKSLNKRQVIIEKKLKKHGPDGPFGHKAMVFSNGVIGPCCRLDWIEP